MNEVGGSGRSATENSGFRDAALPACTPDIVLVGDPAGSLNRSMPLRLHYRRYRLPLRTAIRTAREVWSEREGLLVRVTDEQGSVGYGEVAPIPAFGTESVEQAEAALRLLGEAPTEAEWNATPARFGCVHRALQQALSGLRAARGGDAAPASAPASAARAIAAFLPAGEAALPQIEAKAEIGFRTFKWKVGVTDARDELALLDDVCALLPKGGKLRLDANGAWDRRTAERWLERAADRPIEFIEQPCFASSRDGDAACKRAEDLLLGLANDFPTPLALDESLIDSADAARWQQRGWPGWYVVKPTLMADCDTVLAALRKAGAVVVFSSALETAVGARAALETAFAWTGEPKALGFGVWPLFQDSRFDGPAAAPFIRASDLSALDPEKTWNALA